MPSQPSPESLLEHADWVSALAARLVPDPALAEDLVQATWLEALKTRPGEIRNPRAWLATVLRNAVRQWRRSEDRRRQREEDGAVPESWPSAAELVERANRQREVVGYVLELDEPYRETVLLRFFEGLPQRAIARRLDCPVATVNTRLQRALVLLRGRLDRDYGERALWCAALAPLLAGARRHAARTGVASLGLGVGGQLALLAGALGIAALGIWFAGERRTASDGGVPVRLAALRAARASAGEHVELVDPAVLERTAGASAPRERLGPVLAATGVVEWRQAHGGAAHANYRARRDAIVFPRLLWHVPGPAGQPTVAGGSVYCGGDGLYRIDAATGEVLAWRSAEDARDRPQGDPPAAVALRFASAPALARGAVVARLSDGGVAAFDEDLGRRLWTWNASGPGSSGTARPGVLAADLFVFCTSDAVVALRWADGVSAWRYALRPGDSADMTPAVAQGRVFFGTRAGRLVALALETGTELWEHVGDVPLGGADPVVVAERVLVADRGGRGVRRGALRAFDVERGALVWTHEHGAMDLATPGLGPGAAYLPCAGSLSRVELGSGRAVQAAGVRIAAASECAPLLVGATLFVADRDGFLYARDLERGELAWAFRPPSGRVEGAVHALGRLYVTTADGLFAIADDPLAGRLPRGYVLAGDA